MARRAHLWPIMTDRVNTAPTAREPTDTIAVQQRAGVWRVTLNGDFHGDYARRYWALEAAFEKADDIAASGGVATITWAVDGQQDALLYSTGAPTPLDRSRRWPHRVAARLAKPRLAQTPA